MHGFIVIDKPAGMTSATVVAKVKKMLPKGTKIGHAGTLDPNVTGVLPLAIGKATKSIAYMNNEQKTYQCTMQFGLKTDTADIWGDVIEQRSTAPFNIADIMSALKTLSGRIEQTPPMYSAVKHKGRRLYDLARSGITVERQAKSIEIFSYDDIGYQHPFLHFTVTCSRGTYVRTLCEDIADQLDSVACMTALRRTCSGPFELDQARALAQLTENNIDDAVLPIDIMFADTVRISIDYKHAVHLLNGVKVDLRRFCKQASKNRDLYSVYYKSLFIGVAKTNKTSIRLDKLLIDKETLEDYYDNTYNNRA